MKNILVIFCLVVLAKTYSQETNPKKNSLELQLMTPNFLSGDIIENIDFYAVNNSGEVEIDDFQTLEKLGYKFGFRKQILKKNKYRGLLSLQFSKQTTNIEFEDYGNNYEVDFDISLKKRMIGLNYENEYMLAKKIATFLNIGLARNSLKFNEYISPSVNNDYDKENIEIKKQIVLNTNLGLRYYTEGHLSITSSLGFSQFPFTEIERSGYFIYRKIPIGYEAFYVSRFDYQLNLNNLNFTFGLSYDF